MRREESEKKGVGREEQLEIRVGEASELDRYGGTGQGGCPRSFCSLLLWCVLLISLISQSPGDRQQEPRPEQRWEKGGPGNKDAGEKNGWWGEGRDGSAWAPEVGLPEREPVSKGRSGEELLLPGIFLARICLIIITASICGASTLCQAHYLGGLLNRKP